MTAALTPAALYRLIGGATENLVVLIPRQDYYARAGDSEEYTLEYISPQKLLAALQEHFGG